MTEDGTATLDEVLARLEASLDELIPPTCRTIYHDMDAYAGVPPEALASAVGRNLRTTLTALRQDRAPEVEDLDGAAQTAQERHAVGVPVEEIVRGFRISISLIHDRFVDLALSMRLPAGPTLAGARIIWTTADRFTTRIITEYHALGVEAALHDNALRVASVRRALAGVGLDESLLTLLDRLTPYAAVHAAVPATADTGRIVEVLERTGSTPHSRAVVASDGDTVIGLVARRPSNPGVTVGIGPFGPLSDAVLSDRSARECFALAQRLGRDGVHGIEELGWRLAAADHPEVTALYDRRFLAPLRAEGEFGREVRAAVRAWLEHDRSIPRAAEALTVHVNTIRYRLQRFHELAGIERLTLDDAVGLVWALEMENDRSS